VSKGNYLSTAAERVGLPKLVVRQWKMWGDKSLAEGKQNAYTEFAKMVGQARAMFECNAVENIAEAAKDIHNAKGVLIHRGNWAALAHILERTLPEKFGQKINIEVRQAKEEVLDVVERVVNQHVQGVLARKILQGLYEELVELDRRREAGETESG
jgi:hypothetical protein